MTALQIIVLAYVTVVGLILAFILWLAARPTPGEHYLKWVESLPLLDQEKSDAVSAEPRRGVPRRAPSPRRHRPVDDA